MLVVPVGDRHWSADVSVPTSALVRQMPDVRQMHEWSLGGDR